MVFFTVCCSHSSGLMSVLLWMIAWGDLGMVNMRTRKVMKNHWMWRSSKWTNNLRVFFFKYDGLSHGDSSITTRDQWVLSDAQVFCSKMHRFLASSGTEVLQKLKSRSHTLGWKLSFRQQTHGLPWTSRASFAWGVFHWEVGKLIFGWYDFFGVQEELVVSSFSRPREELEIDIDAKTYSTPLCLQITKFDFAIGYGNPNYW